MIEADGGFRHARHGYWLARPAAGVPAWERFEVEGAFLAYRRPGPIWMSLQSRCGRPTARPQVMARHLLLGIPHYTVRQNGPAEVGGVPGWTQIFDAAQGESVIRVKTVTAVATRCAFDFILSARAGFEGAEPSFDAWWGSLRIDPEVASEPEQLLEEVP